MNDRTNDPKLQGPHVARSPSFLPRRSGFVCRQVSGHRLTRRSHAAHIEEPGGLRPLTAAPAGPQLLSGRRLPPLFAQPLVTFTVPANLLPQPLVQLFACGLVLRLSDRRVLSSTPPVVGVDLLWVFRPPLRACLGVAGSALGAQPAALLSMSRELRLVFLLPALAAGLHGRVFRSFFSRKASAGCALMRAQKTALSTDASCPR